MSKVKTSLFVSTQLIAMATEGEREVGFTEVDESE